VPTRPSTWKIFSAFAVIYLVWGSTFLAIRIGVQQVPPLLLAAMRFFAAGILLFAYTRLKTQVTQPGTQSDPLPTSREWLSVSLLAILIFVVDYGLLFWAEQRIPSGIAAVILATIPAFTALAEILLLRTRKLTARLTLALLAGLAGVAILTLHSISLGGKPVAAIGAWALIVGAIAWSVASALTRKLPLPASKLTSSAAQMTLGGLMLFLASLARGELRSFHPLAVSAAAWWSLGYLILAGSILGFTTYLWLLHHESPTKVSTYAYVNPVVAVILGYFFANEALDIRTVLGTLLVIAGVVIITTTPTVTAPHPKPRP
jgi:drug/metabolite transporter (DMT)-like permease